MKKITVWIFTLVCTMNLLVGCGTQVTPQASKTEVTSLSQEELANFNGDSFFNGDVYNIRNQFLSSLYDEPANINLFELFYCGSGIVENMTEEETVAVMEKSKIEGGIDDLQCACEKISRSNMDEIIAKFMGITFESTNEIGLEHFVYLSQYDAYYHFHGDTNYRQSINFSTGEREGDIIRLFYNDEFFCDGYKVLIMKEKNGKYLFIANQYHQ